MKEKLGCRYYVRYMDDFVILHDDKDFLWAAKNEIENYLAQLNLELHENKCRIFSNEKGVPFLGLLIFPDQRRIRRNNLIRFKRRLRGFQRNYKSGKVDWQHINQSVQSWLGYAKHADSFKIRELVLKDIVF